jgi:hypothetical protein
VALAHVPPGAGIGARSPHEGSGPGYAQGVQADRGVVRGVERTHLDSVVGEARQSELRVCVCRSAGFHKYRGSQSTPLTAVRGWKFSGQVEVFRRRRHARIVRGNGSEKGVRCPITSINSDDSSLVGSQ